MCIRDRYQRRVHGENKAYLYQNNKNLDKLQIIIMEVQSKKAFQKQDAVFLCSKKIIAKQGKEKQRYYKDVGLGFETPKEAIEGTYIDRKCPFTSGISIRGKILKGICVSTKMENTIIIRRNYLHYIKKYKRFEKRHKNIPAHCSPCFRPKEGDIIYIGQCRPIAKTVRFNVLRVIPNQFVGSAKKQFVQF
eukprot:TRINITY_DN120_c0_g1_i3.p2 TRINITY_DN120_c0_g1~~TRINITY_DN120_c0_g1_i3.p2  ORF type:complete len:191 (-),score=67.41 TRINITY_DN120_c0_g1_i3:131-703(-)